MWYKVKWPWMCFHPFLMTYGCIWRVWQSCMAVHTNGCPPSRPKTSQYMGPGLAGYTNHQAIHMEVWDMMWGTNGHGWGVIHFTFLANAKERKGLTGPGCNPYTGMPSIQATDHQSYGPRFCRICKPLSHQQVGVIFDARSSSHECDATLFSWLVNI